MRTRHTLFFLAIAAAPAAPASCGGDKKEAPPETTVVVFDTASDKLFDVPFPSELRRKADGRIDLSLFPNPRRAAWIRDLIDAVQQEGLPGFGTNGAVYLRFSAPVDTATLPAGPRLSAAAASSVVLVDVDGESPALGRFIPFHAFYREEEGFQWQPHTLALLPAQGFVLRPGTLYCAAVTSDVKDAAGAPVGRDEGFAALVDDAPDDGPLFSDMEKLHREALARLDDAGVDPARVAGMALFRTMDPADEMRRVARAIAERVEPPAVDELRLTSTKDDYYLFEGRYSPNPVFQQGWSSGLYPYRTEGGAFVFDGNGDPVIDGEETMDFAFTVPRTVMPGPGYPLLLYAHGTGGDFKSFVRDGTAGRMARLGIAALGVNNSMNGTRIGPDDSADLLFFNITNIRAGRDNNRQAAADMLQLERLADVLVIGAGGSPTGEELKVDPARIAFMGHSQGGLNGGLYLALTGRCRGGYLSGSGGNLLYSLAYKTSPINIMAGVGLVIGLTGDEMKRYDFGIYHPLLTLIQTAIDPSDPVNFARFWFSETFEGVPPKHILQSEGLGDTYAPPETIEPLGVAGELSPIAPVIREVEGFSLKGAVPLDKPVSANAAAGTSRVTAGFVQYPESEEYDGHFVSFHNEEAIATWTHFVSTLLEGGPPEIR